MLKLGMMGLSEGNGHPYSFSAIINGFDREAMAAAGWDNIYAYLIRRDASELGVGDTRVTHVWTQDRAESEKIAAATRIDHVVTDAAEMIGQVDGVLLCRDDFQRHREQAAPFLEAGLPVFIDKPLSLDPGDLAWFRPYLERGKLMSCSGFRYARELDNFREDIRDFGPITLVRGAAIKGWDKYAIHLLDAIFSVLRFDVETVRALPARHESVMLRNRDGSLIQIDALGASALTFQLDFWSEGRRFHAELKDFFSAFRRTVTRFVRMVETGEPDGPTDHVIDLMRVLIAGRRSHETGEELPLADVVVPA